MLFVGKCRCDVVQASRLLPGSNKKTALNERKRAVCREVPL